jgi:hypothetical protein
MTIIEGSGGGFCSASSLFNRNRQVSFAALPELRREGRTSCGAPKLGQVHGAVCAGRFAFTGQLVIQAYPTIPGVVNEKLRIVREVVARPERAIASFAQTIREQLHNDVVQTEFIFKFRPWKHEYSDQPFSSDIPEKVKQICRSSTTSDS